MEKGRRSGEPPCARDGRGRVLVVEDDGELSGFLTECLEMAGYQVIQSSNGLEGLRALDTHRPDLAVVDLNMPVMSGFRLLRLLRANSDPGLTRVPVIVITGSDLQEAMDVVVQARPDAYLQKPFRPEQLLERVGHLLGRDDR